MKGYARLAAILAISISTARAEEIRIGIIGCDTSHVIAFTEILNNPAAKGHVPGGRVVAAYKGGSPDVPESANRVEDFANTLQEKYGVTMYERIGDLVSNVDAILLESLDGRTHLEQFRAIVRAGSPGVETRGAGLLLRDPPSPAARKPVFIDKPMAASLREVGEIFRLSKRSGVPVFTSSALRFGQDTQAVSRGSLGKLSYVETFGPCSVESHHPDLFWYGIHGVEALYALMGTGCETVQRSETATGQIEVTGTWPEGRKGVFREDKSFHGKARGEKGEGAVASFDGYVPLVGEIMRFFQTGVAPMKPEETIEIFAFMEAADASKAGGGAPVKVSELLKQVAR